MCNSILSWLVARRADFLSGTAEDVQTRSRVLQKRRRVTSHVRIKKREILECTRVTPWGCHASMTRAIIFYLNWNTKCPEEKMFWRFVPYLYYLIRFLKTVLTSKKRLLSGSKGGPYNYYLVSVKILLPILCYKILLWFFKEFHSKLSSKLNSYI